MTARYAPSWGRIQARLRVNPAGSSAAYGVFALNAGLTPHLRDTHGPDAGQETYDAVCHDLGMDPLRERVAS